jgi:hypothetical protein
MNSKKLLTVGVATFGLLFGVVDANAAETGHQQGVAYDAKTGIAPGGATVAASGHMGVGTTGSSIAISKQTTNGGTVQYSEFTQRRDDGNGVNTAKVDHVSYTNANGNTVGVANVETPNGTTESINRVQTENGTVTTVNGTTAVVNEAGPGGVNTVKTPSSTSKEANGIEITAGQN